MNDLQALLAGIKSRSTGSRWGIGTAAMYLASIAPCFGDGAGLCPSTVFEKHTPADWLKALKDAEERLTYCEEECPLDTKAIRNGSSVPGAILEFDHVITTTKKDRDGDILECAGMNVDKSMPLLWQHVPMQPLGPFLGTTKHDTTTIAGKSAILDTAFGRDVAILTEGGALRISQGFKAYEFEPLIKKDAADKLPYGFHVKKGDIMEVSLVSVPANTDAVITAYSRQKLFHPLVTKWAGNLFEGRRKMFSVAVVFDGNGNVIGLESKEAKAEPAEMKEQSASQSDSHKCTCDASNDTAATTSNSNESDNSSTEGSDTMSTATNNSTNAAPNLQKATPSALLNAAGGGNGANGIRVKSPSEMYCKNTKPGLHVKTREQVHLNGTPLYTPSELQLAKIGVFAKHRLANYKTILQRYDLRVPELTAHERSLLEEIYKEDAFCGEKANGEWVDRATVEQAGLNKKSLLDDALSGGQNLVPFEFDTAVITYPLLHSEILPFIDMRECRSSEVKSATFSSVNVNWGTAEGSEISLFNTDSIIGDFDVPIFPVAASCLIGKDIQADSPVAIGKVMMELFGQAMLKELDYVVCLGNGTSQPEGFFNATGTNGLNADNGSGGPPTLNDYIKLQFGIAKQYRSAGLNEVYVSNDTSYQRSRQLKVDPATPSTDQRLLLGMGLQDYATLGFAHKIQNSISNRATAFVCLKKYIMYRRAGFDFTVTDQGEGLVRRNEALLVVRGRYGGALSDASACAVIEDGQS